jgi:SAM-dependent methyltransferase
MEILIEDIVEAHRTVFDSIAAEYEERCDLHLAITNRRVEDLAELMASGASVIDVGCGVGLAMSLFRKRGFQSDGVELSDQMARYCARRNPRSQVFVGDFLSMKINSTYDLVFAQSFVHLFPSTISPLVFEKLGALVKPSGILSVSTNVAAESNEGWLPKDDYPGGPIRFRRMFTRNELLSELRYSGCTIIDECYLTDSRGKEFLEISAQRTGYD